jgi:hypothetical protein
MHGSGEESPFDIRKQHQHHRYDVFDVVYHFSQAAELIKDPAQRLLIAKLNLQAAIKGKNSMGALRLISHKRHRHGGGTHAHVPHILSQRTRWHANWPSRGLRCFRPMAG